MNDFILKRGFTAKSVLEVTGSLIVTSGITGSSTTASFSVTSSYSINSATASLTFLIDSSSYSFRSETSSYSYEADYVLNPNYDGWVNPDLGSIGINPNVWYPINGNSMIVAAGVITQSIILSPIQIYKNCTINRLISIYSHTNANATSSFFVYTNSEKLLPENKIYQTSISGSTFGAVTGSFSPTSSIQLEAGEVYWIGVASQNASSIYAKYFSNVVANTSGRIYNPILGVAVPNTSSYIQNITHYVYPIPGNIDSSAPETLSQNTGDYSFLARSTATPVLPYLIVN
jgi:hypothetical protein